MMVLMMQFAQNLFWKTNCSRFFLEEYPFLFQSFRDLKSADDWSWSQTFHLKIVLYICRFV